MDTGGRVRGRRSSDGANRVFFQIPRSSVNKRENPDPSRRSALAASLSPSSFVTVSPRKDVGPRLADEVRNEDDESTGNGDFSWFELNNGSVYAGGYDRTMRRQRHTA